MVEKVAGAMLVGRWLVGEERCVAFMSPIQYCIFSPVASFRPLAPYTPPRTLQIVTRLSKDLDLDL